MPVRALAPQPPLSCSAEPLPSEITGTCTGEVAAGWPRQAESWGVGQAPWQGTLGGTGSAGAASPPTCLLPDSLFLKSPFVR